MSRPRFFEALSELDGIMREEPTTARLERFAKLVSDAAARHYAFQKLTDASWLQPLREMGCFADPPQPIEDADSGAVSYPSWPESRFLARVASVLPEEVLAIALEIPETANPRVHTDLVNIALSLPGGPAAKIASREVGCISSVSHVPLLLPSKLGELVCHLAEEGYLDTAFELARELLSTEAGEPRSGDESGTRLFYPEPRSRVDIWQYEELLRNVIPVLASADRSRTLSLVTKLLDAAIEQGMSESNSKAGRDYSTVWRSAIEDHDQNLPYSSPKEFLVSPLRDTAQSCDETSRPQVLEFLEGQRFGIYRRIGLHLRRVWWPDTNVVGTVDVLMSRDTFDNPECRHEYFHLLQTVLQDGDSTVLSRYLSLVEESVDLDEWIEASEKLFDERPSEEDQERYVRRWTYRKLWPAQALLTDDWKARFDDLKSELGELDHPDFESYTTSWVGPESPSSSDDIRTMEITQLTHFLMTWEPTGEPMSPSREGLARELTAVVAADPARYATCAMEFKGVRPIYARGLVDGWKQAARQKTEFDWDGVLEFCLWVVEQPRAEAKLMRDRGSDEDATWGWARQAIAYLVSDGLAAGEASIPRDSRGRVWDVLEPITGDPHPRPEDEKGFGESQEPVVLSLNTVRSVALHSVMRYALWARGDDALKGLDGMPEVKRVLECHLDPTRDPSLGVRAVYGQWFPWLVSLDSAWAAANASSIFPRDEGCGELRSAAWQAYILQCGAYDGVLEILRDEYELEVSKLAEPMQDTHGRLAQERLSEHLMVFAWRGKLAGISEDGMLSSFYSAAPLPIRKHALSFIGRSLDRSDVAVPDEVLGRLESLWVSRLAYVQGSVVESDWEELAGFGWWFASGKSDDSWSLAQLRLVTSHACGIEADHRVAKRLADLANEFPSETVVCLDFLVRLTEDSWGVEMWKDEAKSIIQSVLNSESNTAQEVAQDLVHRLGAMGYYGFGQLLSG